MRRIGMTVVSTAMACIVAAGCSAQTHRYDSAIELRSAAVNAGLHCTGYQPTTPPQGAASSGACVGGTPAQFVVYDDDDKAKSAIASVRSGLAKGQALLAGPNWYVQTSTKQASDLQDAVGGDVEAGPTS